MPRHIAAGLTVAVAIVATVQAAEIAIDAEGLSSPIDGVTLLQSELQTENSAKIASHVNEPKPEHEHSAPQNSKISLGTPNFNAAAAEFVAMALFIVIGCGSAMAVKGDGGWVLQVALSFGLAITALAYAVGHYSGGQINPAVTLGLVLSGQCSITQGVGNVIAQLLGSIVGAYLLTLMFPEGRDQTGSLATNHVDVERGYTVFNAFVAEAVATFLLVFVVLETATNPASEKNRDLAALAIGFTVFLAHTVLIKIDGCSINPARSFGPALVRKLVYKSPGYLSDMWVFWVGPVVGAAGAAVVSAGLMA